VRDAGLGKLGIVAVDSTPIAAHNGKQRVDTRSRLRQERAQYRRQVRHWQKQCDAAGAPVAAEYAAEQLQRVQHLAELPQRWQALKKSGEPQLQRTDSEARVLRKRGRSVIGNTAELAKLCELPSLQEAGCSLKLATFRCKMPLNLLLGVMAPNAPTDCKALTEPHSSVRQRKVEFCTEK
jgi:hypothetical protein